MEWQCARGDEPLKGMAAITMRAPPALRSAVVTEEHHSGMVGLGSVGKEVERGVVVQEEVLRVPLLRANDVRSLHGVAAEEDGLRGRR